VLQENAFQLNLYALQQVKHAVWNSKAKRAAVKADVSGKQDPLLVHLVNAQPQQLLPQQSILLIAL
jgi:hypothetical protein